MDYSPGHSPAFGYTRADADDVAWIAWKEGYQWSGGCYDNDNSDPTHDWTPQETKGTLGEGPDCSGLAWRVWRESNYAPGGDPPDRDFRWFYWWNRSMYDHGYYNTDGFNQPQGSGAPHVSIGKSGVINMDAFVSHDHMALEDYKMDKGGDEVFEAKGEKYGVVHGARTYRTDSTYYTGSRRLAWGT